MNAKTGLLGTLAFGALSAACTSMSDGKATAPLEGTSWVLSELPGKTLANGSPATLQFQDGRATGSDGCNRYTMAYHVDGSKIEFPSRPVGTLMACPPGVQQQAQWYIDALLAARSWRVADRHLHLLDSTGSEVAALLAQSQELAATSWSATGINNGRGGVASLVAGSTVSMIFGADGTAAGSAGCNNFTTRFEQSGPAVKFTAPIASTRRMCPDPAVMTQEQAFLKALENTSTARIEGGRLELRDAGGALQVAASVSASAN